MGNSNKSLLSDENDISNIPDSGINSKGILKEKSLFCLEAES